MSDRFELLQVASEFDPVLEIYREAAPERVLEIGCWDGMSLRAWLQEAAPALVVAVDLEHRNRIFYDAWRKPGTDLHVYQGDSMSDEMIAAIREHGPYDWVFVDGDHSDTGVGSDVAVCLPLIRPGGRLLLHDITPQAGNASAPPGVLLGALEMDGYRVRRFEDPKRETWTHGIGLVEL